VRLVLCDDNRIFCEALAVALEARGHQALAIATTADEGVAAVVRHQPDACLLDFRFHEGGDGVGAARAIRDKSPGTAVLVVSDSGRQVASLAATQAGVAGFVGQDSELDRTPRPGFRSSRSLNPGQGQRRTGSWRARRPSGAAAACIPVRCAIGSRRPDRVTELLVKERHASLVWPVLAG